MTRSNALLYSAPTDFVWQATPLQQDQLWRSGQTLLNRAGQWRAYLNRMAEASILAWGNEILGVDAIAPLPTFSDQHHAAWVPGTALRWQDKRLVILPSDEIESDELRVPQEWIDIESWVADYYIAAQVFPESGSVRIWGYTTHDQLKTEGYYCDRDRTYVLDAEALNEDLASLAIALPIFTTVQTRASVSSLPALALNRAEALIEQCSDPHALCPRLIAPFEEWGALLAQDNLRGLLAQRYQAPEREAPLNRWVQLQTWFDQQFPPGWLSINDVLMPVRTQRSFPLCRAKLIDLGLLLNAQPLALVVWLQDPVTTPAGIQYDIRLEVRPTGRLTHLPVGLTLRILDDQQVALTEIIARDRDNWIELSFTVDAGTQFAVQLQLSDERYTESFEI